MKFHVFLYIVFLDDLNHSLFYSIVCVVGEKGTTATDFIVMQSARKPSLPTSLNE